MAWRLKAVERADFDLVLMDSQMPVMDGVRGGQKREAFRSAKSGPPQSANHCVHSHWVREVLPLLAEAGFDAMLQKPAQATDMCDLLARLVPRQTLSASRRPVRSVIRTRARDHESWPSTTQSGLGAASALYAPDEAPTD